MCGKYGTEELYVRPSACSSHAQYLTVAVKAARAIYIAKKENGLKSFSDELDKIAAEILMATGEE